MAGCGKQCRPWPDAMLCGVWSWCTLFVQACLSEYLEQIRQSVRARQFKSDAFIKVKMTEFAVLLYRVFTLDAYITKTCLYNFDPLKPHFYIVKLGFTGAYNIFLFSGKNIDCGYSLELPRWGSSNEYPQSMFWAEIWKYQSFLS